MATRRTPVADADTALEGEVRPLEEIVEVEPDYEGVDEVPTVPSGNLTTTETFFATPGAVTQIIEVEPEIIEGDEPTYKIRLTTDIDTIYIGIDYPIPPMKKDVLYEVSKRVYDYLLPKGLIQGK